MGADGSSYSRATLAFGSTAPLGGARLVLLPDSRFAPMAPVLMERVESFGAKLTAENFTGFLDALMGRMMVDAFRDSYAGCGGVWMVDAARERLIPAHILGATGMGLWDWRPAVTEGLAGMVWATQQPFCGNEIQRNARHDRSLDAALQATVHSLILVPFYIARQIRGLVVAVQAQRPGGPAPHSFSPESLEEMDLLATCLGRLIDYRLICAATGYEED